MNILGDHGDAMSQVRQVDVTRVVTTDLHRTLLWFVEMGEQPGNGRFAAPCTAEQADNAAWCDGEVHVIEHRLFSAIIVVRERDRLESDGKWPRGQCP